MKCPRCLYKTEVVSEYYDYNIQVLVRDTYCSNCKSVLIEKFYENKRYNSDWIDLNVGNRKD
jgi:RNase P subunit RPR2